MTHSKIIYEVKDGIARITLNRPEKRNALDAELIAELKQAISTSAADERCSVGLVHRSYPDDQFAAEANAYAARVASKSASAVMLSKRLLYNMDSMSFEAALEAGVETNAVARMTDDCRKGVERFLTKKSPR